MSIPKFPPLPNRLGVAADLTFIVTSPMAFIADALLLYDQLIIPGDQITLSTLYLRIGAEQLGRLLNARRLAFCPAMSIYARDHDNEFTRSGYLSDIENGLRLFDADEQRVALKQVGEHLVVGAKPDYLSWRKVSKDAETAFIEAAKRPGYEFLQPIDSRSGMPVLDRQVGLEHGLARMNDLVAAGVFDMEMDRELPVLLDVCFPARAYRPVTGRSEIGALKTIENLHRLKNLPSPGKTIVEDKWTDEKAIDLILSDDVSELRAWLHKNVAPDLDVRESYVRELDGLPSKKEWLGWLRFGAVSAVTTTIGALATPVAGALAGIALSATDQKLGPKAMELADPYHPKKWLSIAERGYKV